MARLTKWVDDEIQPNHGYITKTSKDGTRVLAAAVGTTDIYAKLAALEDILCPGDAPEISLDELREMCKAKRENQYTIPFKIGDRIWRLVNDANPHLTRDKIFKIEFRGDGDFVELIGGRIAKLSEFDKSLFISSEAAEAALKDGENK